MSIFYFTARLLGVGSELKMEVSWYKERLLHHMQATINPKDPYYS